LDAAVLQDPASVKLGSGLEHQLPHLYSQFGVGEKWKCIVMGLELRMRRVPEEAHIHKVE
jgi:hypothetical protein